MVSGSLSAHCMESPKCRGARLSRTLPLVSHPWILVHKHFTFLLSFGIILEWFFFNSISQSLPLRFSHPPLFSASSCLHLSFPNINCFVREALVKPADSDPTLLCKWTNWNWFCLTSNVITVKDVNIPLHHWFIGLMDVSSVHSLWALLCIQEKI